jgi:hypothetical protein
MHVCVNLLTLPEAYSILQVLDLLHHFRSLLEKFHHRLPLLVLLHLQFLKREFGFVVLFDVTPPLDVVSGLQVVHDDRFHRIEI